MISGDDLHISVERVLTQDEFDLFARLSGDHNPIHVDPEFSSRSRFGRPVAHGVMLYSIFRGLAAKLVPNARQISQQVMFPAPTYAGNPVRFEAEIVEQNGVDVKLRMVAIRVADDVVTCIAETVLRQDREAQL